MGERDTLQAGTDAKARRDEAGRRTSADDADARTARADRTDAKGGPFVGLERLAGPYFVKAIVLMALLTLFGCLAPHMPSFDVALVTVAYATASTVGALYFVVTRRMLKQYKLADNGSLAHINRRWPLMAAGLFALSLASGVLFLLNAPKWDAAEWVLTWLAVPLYFATYVFLKQRLEKEYAPRFDKAHAMRWSFVVVGAVLCLTYAGISMLSQAPDYPSLQAAYEATYMPFANAPAAVMCEADKLASLTDGLKDYALAKASGASLLVVFVVRVIVYASVFFGLMSQFGACLLSRREAKGDFQLLPPGGSMQSDGPMLKRYFIVLGAIAIAWMSLFVVADIRVAEVQATEEHTATERLVDELIANATIAIDGEAQEMLERKAVEEDYKQQIADVLAERRQNLKPMMDAFYGTCRDNVDAYLDWSDGPEGWMLRAVGFFNTDPIRDKFFEIVEKNADAGVLEERFREYHERLAPLAEEAKAATGGSLDALLDQASPMQRDLAADKLDLWRPVSERGSAADRETFVDVLLARNGFEGRDERRKKLLEIIDAAQADALAAIDVNEA